jgi:hypothetical protein
MGTENRFPTSVRVSRIVEAPLLCIAPLDAPSCITNRSRAETYLLSGVPQRGREVPSFPAGRYLWLYEYWQYRSRQSTGFRYSDWTT